MEILRTKLKSMDWMNKFLTIKTSVIPLLKSSCVKAPFISTFSRKKQYTIETYNLNKHYIMFITGVNYNCNIDHNNNNKMVIIIILIIIIIVFLYTICL